MPPETLERALLTDLDGHPRLADEEFCGELYRGLANRSWHKDGVHGHLALSWSRAEELVNELRAGAAQEPLALAQTGGEGWESPLIRDELGQLGWSSHPRDTSQPDEQHVGAPEFPPPREPGEARAPSEPPEAWRDAHAEADENDDATLRVPSPDVRPGA